MRRAAGRAARVRVVHEGARNGFGSAIRAGVRLAGKDWVWPLVVDMPFSLEAILDALPHMDASQSVISYRSADPRSVYRRLQSVIFNGLGRQMLGVRARHLNSAFKITRTALIQSLDLQSNGWLLDAELIVRLEQRRIPYVEIPVRLVDRSNRTLVDWPPGRGERVPRPRPPRDQPAADTRPRPVGRRVMTEVNPAPRVSIICPAFNEEDGLGAAIAKLRDCLDRLNVPAEVLIVNDGSTDRTAAVAAEAIGTDRRFRVFTHMVNFGRGRAMRTGFQEARGDIIVTTEADLSWGEDVIGRMVALLDRDPRLDAVFASPHLSGGGYRNVPWHRIMLSRLGNRVLRALYPSPLTMTTGMTRAYRAEAIQGVQLTKDGKELHLEIANRLMSLGYRIGEVPAILSWPASASGRASRSQRTDWTKIRRLIASHLVYGFLQGISSIIVPTIGVLTVMILVFGAWAVRKAAGAGGRRFFSSC